VKSMLWSLLLYVVLMLCINWEDVTNRISGRSATIVSVNHTAPETPGVDAPTIVPVKILGKSALLMDVVVMIRTITGY
jgi:hypothetical protein